MKQIEVPKEFWDKLTAKEQKHFQKLAAFVELETIKSTLGSV